VASGDDLREVMQLYPHGVAVLTVDHEGSRMGLTISSLVSLSLEPPLVGVTLGEHAAMLELVREARGFAVSILAGDQAEVAQHFARGVPPMLHWRGIAILGGTVAPLIEGAVGWLECRLAAEHPVGDHQLLVGEVVTARPGAEGAALVYRAQAYSAL
jgi:flavin reductase (DIM6/NTAB) family NADH-FMN oxidoreductase RutF